VPTASKASALVGIITVNGLTIAQCIATKPIFASGIATIVSVPSSQVSVGCNIASTRRRLTSGESPAEVDFAVNYGVGELQEAQAAQATLADTSNEELAEVFVAEAEASTIPEAEVITSGEAADFEVPGAIITDPIVETDIPIDEPTAAPMTLAPTSDDPEDSRKLAEDEGLKALFFIDYGAPGTGAAPTHGRRLSATAAGCQAVAWAPGECGMLLSDVAKNCGKMTTCAGAVCGRKDFLIDGKAACVALGEIDFGAAPRADVYALSKEEAPTAAIVRGPASRKLLFAAAAYGSEVLQVMQDIWHG